MFDGKDHNEGLLSMAFYIDSFAQKLGLGSLQVDTTGLQSVAAALASSEFPHVDGVEKASPFKKAANFFVWFVGSKPIIDELPEHIVAGLKKISNHQNVFFAYHFAVDCLHGAVVYRDDGEAVKLTNKIRVSKHFFRDFVEAFSAAVPVYHFKIASLLFEQLAYKANPSASYPENV